MSLLSCASCVVVPPNADEGGQVGKIPGRPFSENSCFRCALNACNFDASCVTWINCVAACPTTENGVSAEGACLTRCGLPVSGEVLFGCIQDYSTGLLLGCELACTPLALDAGA